MLRVEADPTPGRRSFEVDKQTGDIVDETYIELPTNYVIRRVGLAPKKIALTFDDGPDPEWTPQILDILKAKHVPATFFIIGANMEANPGLVQRDPGRRPRGRQPHLYPSQSGRHAARRR